MFLHNFRVNYRIFFMNNFLLFLFIHKSLQECQNAHQFPKLALQNPGNSHIFEHEDKLILKDGNSNYIVDRLTLNKTPFGKASFINLTKSNKLPPLFMQYCNNSCNYQCSQVNQHLICGMTATLTNCPTMPKEFSQNMNSQVCVENTPLIFYDSMKNIGYQLVCFSSKWDTFKKSLEQLNFMVQWPDVDELENGKISILASTTVLELNATFYGICEFGAMEIQEAIYKAKEFCVNEKEHNWRKISKNKFVSMPEPKNGLILNKNPKFTVLDMQLDQKVNITSFKMTSLSALNNKTYQVYYLSTSTGKIVKAITGNLVSFFYDLWCNIEGEILQMRVCGEHLLVLTTKYLYSLPLHNCESYLTCTKCVQSRDAHCYWNEKEGACMGITDLKEAKTNYLIQDVLNGDAEKQCASEFELRHANVKEIIDKLTDIEKSCSNKNSSSFTEEISEKQDMLGIVRRLEENCSKVLAIFKTENASQPEELKKDLDQSAYLCEQSSNDFSLWDSKIFKFVLLIVLIASILLNFFLYMKYVLKKELKMPTSWFDWRIFKRKTARQNSNGEISETYDCNDKAQDPDRISVLSSAQPLMGRVNQ